MGNGMELARRFAKWGLSGFVPLVGVALFPKGTVSALIALSAWGIMVKRPSLDLRGLSSSLLLAALAFGSCAWSIDPQNTLLRAGQLAGILALLWSVRSLPLSYARKQLPNAYLQIISNGTLLNSEKVEAILEHVSNLVINHYADEYVLRPNIQETVDYLHTHRPDIAAKLNIGYRLNQEVKTNRAGNAPNRKHRHAGFRSRCAYPFFQMVIRPDGKVSMCCNDALGQMTLGDVAADGIRKAWNSPERQEMQKIMRQGRDGIPLCANCDNLAWARPKRIRKFIKQGNDHRVKDEG